MRLWRIYGFRFINGSNVNVVRVQFAADMKLLMKYVYRSEGFYVHGHMA